MYDNNIQELRFKSLIPHLFTLKGETITIKQLCIYIKKKEHT